MMKRLGLWAAPTVIATTVCCMTNAVAVEPATGNAEKGQAIFQRICANCHSQEIGVNKVGPSLWHVIGRPIAAVPDFNYSDNLRERRTDWQVWDQATLNVYLRNPRETVHNVKMFFKGLPDPTDRADVIAYLNTLE
jgi:cytochrome c